MKHLCILKTFLLHPECLRLQKFAKDEIKEDKLYFCSPPKIFRIITIGVSKFFSTLQILCSKETYRWGSI